MRSSWRVGLAMLTVSCVSAPPPVTQAPPPEWAPPPAVAWSSGADGTVETEPACEHLEHSSLTGWYTGTWGKVYLEQRGDRVVGSYECCGGGRLEGTLVGDVLEFRWDETYIRGRGVFRRVAPDRLSGSWGSATSRGNGGPWELIRVR